MNIPLTTSAKIANYKSFGPQHEGFDSIHPTNIIIGRNNSGKSALLDLVEYLCSPRELVSSGRGAHDPSVRISSRTTEFAIERVFSKTTSGGDIPGNHFEYGSKWIDVPMVVEVTSENKLRYVSSDPEMPIRHARDVVQHILNPFVNLEFRRIVADRDIRPEPAGGLSLKGDGEGTSNLVQHFLNDSTADESLVRKDMLDSLNRIFEPYSRFTRILTKFLSNRDRWEIYLEEESKGRIPLSASGSGLKTIILVLAHLILLPTIEKSDLGTYVFGFEELENNLHPGLQRRLFGFVRDTATAAGATVFVTTHSNAVIDLFSTDPDTQMLHVIHDGDSAKVSSLSEYGHHHRVLDDLDFRASDLFQSNGIVWVEGPSDRVYINRFIELVFGGRFREGAHYQCVFYGGKVLARASATVEDGDLSLLRVNRNCAVVIDRDTPVPNATKTRIAEEVAHAGGFVWITRKKEIESTIPASAIRAFYSDESIREIHELEPFDDYLDSFKSGEGKRFLRQKVAYAEEIAPHITEEMIDEVEALSDLIGQLGGAIGRWNPGS